MMKPPQQALILVTGGMLVATYLCAQHLILRPHAQQRHRLLQQVQEAQELLAQQQAMATQWPQLEGYLKRLPQSADPSVLMGDVARLAEQAGVRVIAIRPQPPHDANGVTRLRVELQLESSYHDVGKFLSLVEQAPSYVQVDELTVKAPGFGMGNDKAVSLEQRNTVRMVLSTLWVQSPWSP